MKQYIRTNGEGEAVLNYDELDVAARVNFLQDAKLAAGAIELYLDDPDFSNAEKAEAINSAANVQADHEFGYLETEDGETVEIDAETRQMWVEAVISELAQRYSI